MLNHLKIFLRDQMGLPPWVVLATGGLLAYLVLNALLRKPLTSGWGLLGPLVVGVVLESYEIWVQYRGIGLFAPSNDTLCTILGRHGLDVVLMLAVPIILVAVGVISAK